MYDYLKNKFAYISKIDVSYISFIICIYFINIKEQTGNVLRAVLTIHRIQYVIFYQGKKQIILQ